MGFPQDNGGGRIPDELKEAIEFQAARSAEEIRAILEAQMASSRSLSERLRREWEAIRVGLPEEELRARNKVNIPLLAELLARDEMRYRRRVNQLVGGFPVAGNLSELGDSSSDFTVRSSRWLVG